MSALNTQIERFLDRAVQLGISRQQQEAAAGRVEAQLRAGIQERGARGASQIIQNLFAAQRQERELEFRQGLFEIEQASRTDAARLRAHAENASVMHMKAAQAKADIEHLYGPGSAGLSPKAAEDVKNLKLQIDSAKADRSMSPIQRDIKVFEIEGEIGERLATGYYTLPEEERPQTPEQIREQRLRTSGPEISDGMVLTPKYNRDGFAGYDVKFPPKQAAGKEKDYIQEAHKQLQKEFEGGEREDAPQPADIVQRAQELQEQQNTIEAVGAISRQGATPQSIQKYSDRGELNVAALLADRGLNDGQIEFLSDNDALRQFAGVVESSEGADPKRLYENLIQQMVNEARATETKPSPEEQRSINRIKILATKKRRGGTLTKEELGRLTPEELAQLRRELAGG